MAWKQRTTARYEDPVASPPPVWELELSDRDATWSHIDAKRARKSKTRKPMVHNLKVTKNVLVEFVFAYVVCKRCEHMMKEWISKRCHTAHGGDCRHRIAENHWKTEGGTR